MLDGLANPLVTTVIGLTVTAVIAVFGWLVLDQRRRLEAGLREAAAWQAEAVRLALGLSSDGGGFGENAERWRASLEAARATVDEMDDRTLLCEVLRHLCDRLNEAVEGGVEAFGDPGLADHARLAWSTNRRVMVATIDRIEAGWSDMRPWLEAAGLTDEALRFKAMAFLGEEEDYRRATRNPVASVTDGDGRDDIPGMMRRMFRWVKLSKVLETGDVVWESAAAAVSTYARVTNGLPPDPKGDADLARHGATEFKMIVEQLLKRFRPGPARRV